MLSVIPEQYQRSIHTMGRLAALGYVEPREAAVAVCRVVAARHPEVVGDKRGLLARANWAVRDAERWWEMQALRCEAEVRRAVRHGISTAQPFDALLDEAEAINRRLGEPVLPEALIETIEAEVRRALRWEAR